MLRTIPLRIGGGERSCRLYRGARRNVLATGRRVVAICLASGVDLARWLVGGGARFAAIFARGLFGGSGGSCEQERWNVGRRATEKRNCWETLALIESYADPVFTPPDNVADQM